MGGARWLAVLLLLGCYGSSGDGESEAGSAGRVPDRMTPRAADSDGANAGSSDDAPDAPVQNHDLQVLFPTMYSAFDGVHTFQLPAIVQGVSDAVWSAEPADAVDLAADTETGGAMVTMRQAGDVRITARAGALSGSAMLHITESTPELWAMGEAVYDDNSHYPWAERPPGFFEIPENLTCRRCHGSDTESLDVEHTPQQTGGYSDEELIAITTTGMKPARSPFHTRIPASLFQMLHTWPASPEEQLGLVTYMRSLAPMRHGALDFPALPR